MCIFPIAFGISAFSRRLDLESFEALTFAKRTLQTRVVYFVGISSFQREKYLFFGLRIVFSVVLAIFRAISSRFLKRPLMAIDTRVLLSPKSHLSTVSRSLCEKMFQSSSCTDDLLLSRWISSTHTTMRRTSPARPSCHPCFLTTPSTLRRGGCHCIPLQPRGPFIVYMGLRCDAQLHHELS